MQQVSDFLTMGGYGGFVWPAFGLTALVMVWLLASSLRRLRENERLLARMQAATPARRARRSRGAAGGEKDATGGEALS